jgi:hypothetical protein
MRIVPLLMLMGVAYGTDPRWAGNAFGIWKVYRIDSTDPRFSRERLTVRFEPHANRFEPRAKGEVFTLDRIDGDGRFTTSSTILYFDGKPRDFQDFGCSGTQSSSRLNSQTVEIVRTCPNGEWTRYVRRLSPRPKELVLEITGQQADGRRFERRLVLERH